MPFSWNYGLLAASFALAAHAGGSCDSGSGWSQDKFNTIVTFGDSYTDENRLGYFINNNGSAPPIGWDQPVGLNTATGGRTWARYAAVYSDSTLYNYAVSGAVCSNKESPRIFSYLGIPFPDIAGYELPTFITESTYVRPNGTKFFTGTPDDTVYAIWIGTNDLGNDAYLTDSQIPPNTLADFTDCVYDTVDKLYANGGRYFVLLNIAPLNLLPQYALPENGGLNATQFFPDKLGKNGTEINGRILEEVATVNQVYEYRSPFAAVVESAKYPGIKLANYNVNALITDIYNNPGNYLNGTQPLNVESSAKVCSDLAGANCVIANNTDSYVWFDPLHPSEQTSRVVAREFVGVLGGASKWAEYWG